MKRIIFKKEDLSNLPVPEDGFVTIGVSENGELTCIDSNGSVVQLNDDVKNSTEANAEALASHIVSQLIKDEQQDKSLSNLSSSIKEQDIDGATSKALSAHIASQVNREASIVNEVNSVTSSNFDSIYSKKVSVTFDSNTGIASFSDPVKPLSVMFYIDGLIIEEGVDYNEVVDGETGLITGISLTNPGTAGGGAKLIAYGVYGGFTNVTFDNV